MLNHARLLPFQFLPVSVILLTPAYYLLALSIIEISDSIPLKLVCVDIFLL